MSVSLKWSKAIMFFFLSFFCFFFHRENAQEVDPKQLGWKRVKSARRRLHPDNCNTDCIFCHHIVGWHFRGREVHGRRRSAAYSSHDWLAQEATGMLPPQKNDFHFDIQHEHLLLLRFSSSVGKIAASFNCFVYSVKSPVVGIVSRGWSSNRRVRKWSQWQKGGVCIKD